MIKEIENNISYADGYNINLGKKTTELLNIEVFADGKFQTRDLHAPSVLDPLTSGKERYAKLTAAGAYARLGESFINEEQYGAITGALKEMEAEFKQDAEFVAVKHQEETKESENGKRRSGTSKL